MLETAIRIEQNKIKTLFRSEFNFSTFKIYLKKKKKIESVRLADADLSFARREREREKKRKEIGKLVIQGN